MCAKRPARPSGNNRRGVGLRPLLPEPSPFSRQLRGEYFSFMSALNQIDTKSNHGDAEFALNLFQPHDAPLALDGRLSEVYGEVDRVVRLLPQLPPVQ